MKTMMCAMCMMSMKENISYGYLCRAVYMEMAV